MGARKIRVTETRVVEYEPDFEDSVFYSSLEEPTLEAAIAADQKDYVKGELALIDLGEVNTAISWEIIEVD